MKFNGKGFNSYYNLVMDLVFSVNSVTQDLRYGDPATGSLSTINPLGFACYQLVVMPGQRYVYVSGNKLVGNEHHAWFAAFDTCEGTVTKEIDLGPGFGGQVAVPGAVGGIKAYVAVSQAVGTTDTGSYGGTNRIEVLNIVNPDDPVRQTGAFQIPRPPGLVGNFTYGTLHLVWSVQLNRLYTTHRGNGWLYSIDPLGGAILPEIEVQEGPTGMALSRNGFILYVGRRLAGDIVAYSLLGPQAVPAELILLPQGKSGSSIYLAVDSQDRIIATSAQRDSTPQYPNPNPNPVPGQVFVIEPFSNNVMPKVVDTQGTWLSQPAPTPDATRVFVPRGDQNDVVEIDPAPNPPTMDPNPIAVGHSPADVVAVDHVAGQTLVATPTTIQGDCNTPQQVTISAYDACGNEMQGIPIQRIVTGGNPFVSPAQQSTPATFDVQCTGHDDNTSISFTTVNVFPFSSISVSVQCHCPIWRCLTFTGSATGPITPVHLAGAIPIQIVNAGVFQGPQIILRNVNVPDSGVLRMYHGTVRFIMPQGFMADGLIVRYSRYDSLSQPEVVTVTHAGGTTPVSNTVAGITQGDHEIVCPFPGIQQWTIAGGAETWIREICLLLPPGTI